MAHVENDTLRNCILNTISYLFLHSSFISQKRFLEMIQEHTHLFTKKIELIQDTEKSVFTLNIDFGDVQLSYTLYYHINETTNAFVIDKIE